MGDKERKKCPAASVGGQAVIEGVAMMGTTAYATAVRDPEGEIQVEGVRTRRSKSTARARRIPLVRGVVNVFDSFWKGMKTLMRSAEVAGDEDGNAGRAEKWFARRFHVSLTDVLSVVSIVIGVALAYVLFSLLPNMIVGWIDGAVERNGTPYHEIFDYLILGAVKLVFFFAYLGLMLLIPSMRRMYRYHGAEHKTINCFESGKELTVENVMSSSRIHDRCGTSFMFIILLVNIVVFSLVNWAIGVQKIGSGVLRVLARLGVEIVLLPVIAAVGYEILRALSRSRGRAAEALKVPGTFMQKVFTTREPDEEMCEVAIAAFERVREMDADPEVEETRFVTGGLLSQKLDGLKKLFAENGIDASDAEWIFAVTMRIKRSDLYDPGRKVTGAQAKEIERIARERLTGRPLWYIIGDTDFCGCRIRVDERALIPRPETEMLAYEAAKICESGDRVLDMCTGSGCVAVAIAKACEDREVSVTASDVSAAAVELAKENAALNGVSVRFLCGDMFEKVKGRYNLIVCNPPYVPTRETKMLAREIREFEPKEALDGGRDGLDFYRRLSEEAPKHLVKGGMIMLEYGEGQLEEILELFPGREYFIPMKDLSGEDRFVKIAY